ncbi:MAG: glycosyltransferase family 39 protein [Candidatus Bathyarchaeota archaeon]
MSIRKQSFLLIIIFFVLIYAALLSLSLDWRAVLWDEAPHLNGGILLSRGDFFGYIQKSGSFYPPLIDSIIALYFKVLGLSLFSARLVSVTFGVLSVLCTFTFAYHFYGKKTALLSSVLLASMPGFVWLCRVAMIETVLIFLFSSSLFLFFFWTQSNSVKALFFAGLTLSLAFLVKYQALVAAIIMLLSLVLLFRKKVSIRLVKFLVISISVGLIISVPFLVLFGSEAFESWSYVVMEGSEERLGYSNLSRLHFGFIWFIFMVLEKETAGKVFVDVVFRSLFLFHAYSKQKLALCDYSFPDSSYFCL